MAELEPKDARIAELEAQVVARDAAIVELMAKVEALTARVAELEARLSQNSSNSSKPPSSDAPRHTALAEEADGAPPRPRRPARA